MNFEHFVVLIGMALVIYLIINISYSKEIYYFVPTAFKKGVFLLILWLLPFLGALFVHHHRYLKPMRNYKEGSAEDGNAISSSFLEIDSVFNPGARNYIENVQQVKTSQQQKKNDDKDKNESGGSEP